MIFVDSNVPMHIVGAPDPNKERAIRLTTELLRNGEQLITSVEVYQEILHRYTSVRRPEAIDIVIGELDRMVEEVLPYGMPEVREARRLLAVVPNISARDALHVAVMQAAGCSRVLSFDAGFSITVPAPCALAE
jgi:predicted nucleic acid-binding protein